MAAAQPNKALLKEVEKGAKLESAKGTHNAADDALARAKIESAIKSGKAVDNLKEVAPPKEGVSDAVKKAYLEDQKEKGKK
jgi:hypothetical protein